MAATFQYERAFSSGRVAGVDEAGRGPLAGPVVAAAVILNPQTAPKGLADSKALSSRQRESLAVAVWSCADVSVAYGEPDEIDRYNILQATLRVMARAIGGLNEPPDAVLVDGNQAPSLNVRCQTLVGGDALSASIAAASIIAKTARDALMNEAGARAPGYGFERHAGYPTRAHREALVIKGPLACHRRSFRLFSDDTLKPASTARKPASTARALTRKVE